MSLNHSSSSSGEQQPLQRGLHFRIDSGLPYAVSPKSIDRAARRELRAFPMPDQADPFRVLRYMEKVALLRQLRRRYRVSVRQCGGAAVYAGTPEGRRVHRTMDNLTLQIAVERTSLCG